MAGKKASPKREEKKNAGETPALLKREAMKSAGEDACATLRSGWHNRGYLPHLKAECGTYFVTFRSADTLPKEVLERYRFERDDIVKRAEAAGRELAPGEESRLAELYTARIDSYLDAGHGKCWLKEPEIGRMVAKALLHFDGERYSLHASVVMPNHVHAVLTPHEGHTLSDILQNWKSFTAHEAQKVAQASRLQKVAQASRLQKVAQASRLQIPKGKAFWQRESFDHLVRDEADFARVCQYTVQNPVEAGLCGAPEEWAFGSAHAGGVGNAEECRQDACATETRRKAAGAMTRHRILGMQPSGTC